MSEVAIPADKHDLEAARTIVALGLARDFSIA